METDTIEKAYDLIIEANRIMLKVWLESIFLSWKWWICIVVLTCGSWAAWFKFRKKESTDRLLYAGFFIIMISSWFDFLGVSYGLWTYKENILPTLPSFILWDFTLMPISIMFLLQYKSHVNPFIKAAFFGVTTAFLAEPFFHWIGFYEPKTWKCIYSFPIYCFIYLVAHYVSTREKFAKL